MAPPAQCSRPAAARRGSAAPSSGPRRHTGSVAGQMPVQVLRMPRDAARELTERYGLCGRCHMATRPFGAFVRKSYYANASACTLPRDPRPWALRRAYQNIAFYGISVCIYAPPPPHCPVQDFEMRVAMHGW
jgi:hypothetical protein